jgi:DNA-binding Xre family transcriptional regulator
MILTEERARMKGAIRFKLPQLLRERGLTASDLMYGARLAPGTSYRLAKGDAEAISFDVLVALCNFLSVGVDDLLEYVPDNDSGLK